MSKRTITLEAPNGAKVRTVHSRRYFVVRFGEIESEYNRKTGQYDHFETPKPVAAVLKRTDSAIAAYAVMRNRSDVIAFGVSADGETKRAITTREMGWDADAEKSRKKFLSGVGQQGEARRLFY